MKSDTGTAAVLDDKCEASPSYPVGQPGGTVASFETSRDKQHLIRRPSANRAAGRSTHLGTAPLRLPPAPTRDAGYDTRGGPAVALATRSEATPSTHGKPCSIACVYDAVADEPVELRELNAILYEEGNTQAQVFEYLTRDGGYTIGFQSVNKHRGKNCRCFREPPFRFCMECKRDLPSCVCGAA